MNRFDTNRKYFNLLPISILIGIGCFDYGIKKFDFNIQQLFLISSGIFMALGIPIYALVFQKKIEVNHIEKYVEIYYPILKNINDSNGMTHDETIIISKENKVKFASNEITFFESLESKLKHELKNKIEIL